MKKKLLLCVCLSCIIAIFGSAATSEKHQSLDGILVELNVSGGPDTNPTTGDNPHPRSPIVIPEVSVDGYTLYLYNIGYDMTVQLLDEDGYVVYTTFVPASTPTVVLPSTLSGDYELRLIPSGSAYYFYGDITL
jgi:hypothetical protein